MGFRIVAALLRLLSKNKPLKFHATLILKREESDERTLISRGCARV
jgi:hypothetical protein